jgi:hypothetical protein
MNFDTSSEIKMENQSEFTSYPDTSNNMLYNQPDFDDNFFIDIKEEDPHFYQKDSTREFSINEQDLNNLNSEFESHEPYSQNDQGGQQDNGQHKRTRASGEVLALLIEEFNQNPNPNAKIRKRISDQTGMPERSVRIWFQNRRAKSRKLEKAQATEDRFGNVSEQEYSLSKYDGIPLNLNNSYYFIDVRSLTVGSWKRLKSGNLSSDNIFSVKNLSNLSPLSINDILNNSTDLMIVISKKNFEINYFFSAITENSKVLFRIFFPISSVSNCSLSICTEEDEKGPTCESKIYLNKPPKFAVSFANAIRPDSNQWSICDDFSEGHQVNDAFIGGSGIPHVFHGLEPSLKFVNSFIMDYNSSNIRQQEFALPQRFTTRSPTYFQDQNPLNVQQQHDLHTCVIQPQNQQQHQAFYERHHHQVHQPNPNPSPQINIDSNSFDVDENPLLHQFVKDEFIQTPDSFDVFINDQHGNDNSMLMINNNDQGRGGV